MINEVGIVCVVSDDLIKEKKLSAGKIVGELAKLVGGGGGGGLISQLPAEKMSLLFRLH